VNLSPFLYGLTEIIGLKATLLLVEEHGGTPLYVPSKMTEQHPLATLIGVEAARKLAQAYPGEVISIALNTTGDHATHAAQRRARIRELDAQGLSQKQIARKLRTTDRTVRKVLGAEVDDRQVGLF